MGSYVIALHSSHRLQLDINGSTLLLPILSHPHSHSPRTTLQLQAFFLVDDDIMDGSITRRGQPCWYKQEHVQMIAINDCILLEACIFRILKKHFADLACYTK